MPSVNRYTVWAVFGVDANSPEQAKDMIGEIISGKSAAYRIALRDGLNVNATVFINPELDKMLDEIEEE